MVERVAAVECICTIMSESGNASVEVQSPGIAWVIAAQRALLNQRGDAMKSPHPHPSAY